MTTISEVRTLITQLPKHCHVKLTIDTNRTNLKAYIHHAWYSVLRSVF